MVWLKKGMHWKGGCSIEFVLPILLQTKPCSVVPARSDCLCRGSLSNVLDGISSRYCEDQVSHTTFNCPVLISSIGFRR